MKLGGRAGNRRPTLAPDPELVRTLAALLNETGLTEIEYAIGDHRIRVVRGSAKASVAETVIVAPPPVQAPLPVPPMPAANGYLQPDRPGTLKSPMVGVVYLAPLPGAPPFARVGDQVLEGQTLLIIEAMKVMNQIKAPQAGRLAQILIADAEPVEYGTPLMLIE